MSGYVFPSLSGQKFTKRKTPVFNTKAYPALSGKEGRISFRAYPLYEWELEFEALPDNRLPTGAARANYIPYSNDATQGSMAVSGTGVAGVVIPNYTTAPDGTLTADRVILNKGSGSSSSNYASWQESAPAPIGSTFTSSLWIKTNDGTSCSILMYSGAVGNGYTVIPVGPTWQRVSVTTTISGLNGAVTYVQIALIGSLGSTVNYADLSIWGMQSEPGGLATPNIFTNGTAIRVSDLKSLSGFYSQMLGSYDTFLYQDPDFNTVSLQQFGTGNASSTLFNLLATWAPGAEITQYAIPAAVLGEAGSPDWVQNCNGSPQIYTGRWGGPELLGYASRKNLVLQSNLVASWASTNAGITINSVSSPDGTLDGATINEGAATGAHYIDQASITITGGGRYTFSAWLGYSTCQYVQLGVNNGGSDAFIGVFDLKNGVVSGVNQTGTAYGSLADATITAFPNGWYRCSISGQLAAGDTAAEVFVAMMNSAAATVTPSYTGTNRIVDFFGAQFESGTQPTALIPTTSSQVTEAADYTLTTLSTSGAVWTFQQVSFTNAPANNVPLFWSGSFFYRCRFSDDKTDFSDMMYKLWENGTISFQSILL